MLTFLTPTNFTFWVNALHTRLSRPGVGWEGATTRLATASKEEQRAQPTPGRLNRVCPTAVSRLKTIQEKCHEKTEIGNGRKRHGRRQDD